MFATEMPGTYKLLALALIHLADDQGRVEVVVETLSEQTALDRRTIIHNLGGLQSRGWLDPVWVLKAGTRSESRAYVLRVPALPRPEAES